MESTTARGATLLMGLAALVAALALLVFALGYVGVIGDGAARDPTDGTGSGSDAVAGRGSGAGSDAYPEGAPTDASHDAEAGDGSTAARTPADPGAYPVDDGGAGAGGDADAPGEPTAPPTVRVGPTAKLSPTPGPSPTVPESAVVESWSRFGDDDALNDAASENDGWVDNEIDLHFAGPSGERSAVVLYYGITAAAPNDYVGFEWDLATRQDWRGYGALVVPLEAHVRTLTNPSPEPGVGDDRQVVLQFHEISGEVWRHRHTYADIGAAPVRIPLEPAAWEWADWSENRNLELDLESVTRMGLFVGHAGPGAGEVVIGEIRVER